MTVLGLYILKSSFCLVAFYFFYKILLAGETFYRLNRIFLVSVLLLSFILPLCEISVKADNPIAQIMMLNYHYEVEAVSLNADAEVKNQDTSILSFSWDYTLYFLYFAGVLFLFLRQFYSVIHLLFLLRRSKKRKYGDISLVFHRENIPPFSWMRYVVLSEKDWNTNPEEILLHEQAHVHYRHSYDLLLMEVVCLMSWFNPIVWLMKKELHAIHEFEADQNVLNQGIDTQKYQLLLIRKAVGTQRFNSMTNGFHQSKLKKRITMMSKQKSNVWARLKYLCVLPLTATVLVAFASPESQNENNLESSVYENSEKKSDSESFHYLTVKNIELVKNENHENCELKDEKSVRVVTRTTIASANVSGSASQEGSTSSRVYETKKTGNTSPVVLYNIGMPQSSVDKEMLDLFKDKKTVTEKKDIEIFMKKIDKNIFTEKKLTADNVKSIKLNETKKKDINVCIFSIEMK